MRSNSALHAPHSFLGDQERFELSSATRITEKVFSAEKRSESYCLEQIGGSISEDFLEIHTPAELLFSAGDAELPKELGNTHGALQ